jgi:hypothetical protein
MRTMTTVHMPREDGGYDYLSRGQAVLLIATLSIALWGAVIGVIYFGMVS